MSQLRAKQIKLVAAGDLIVGGASGNGSVLTKGASKQFLRVKADGSTLEYADLIAGDIAFDAGTSGLTSANTNAAIVEVNSALQAYKTSNGSALADEIQARTDADSALGLRIDGVSSDLSFESTTRSDADSALGLRIDNVNTASGLTGDAYVASTTSNYLNAATSLFDADLKLDAAVKANYDLIQALGSAFNYVGTLEGGVDAASAFDLATLATGGKDAGDYYKVTTAGYFKVDTGAAFFANVGDGLVFNTSGGVDKIDNTNSNVAGTNGRVSVTGSTDTGFVVDIDAAYVGQNTITTLGTVTTGTWNADVVGTAFGGTGLATVGADNQVLTATGGALAYSYVGALRDAAGFAGLELGTVATGKLVVSSDASKVKLAASGATNSDLVLAPAGTGKVIIGEAGAAVLESDAGQTLTLKANGAELVLSGTQVKAEAGYVVTDALSFTTKDYVDTAINTAVDAITVSEQTDELVAVGGETTITLAHTPTAGTVKVFFNGVKLRAVTHYTVAGTTVTLDPVAIGYAVDAGDVLEAVYNYNSAV
jgi:hypothetical protein